MQLIFEITLHFCFICHIPIGLWNLLLLVDDDDDDGADDNADDDDDDVDDNDNDDDDGEWALWLMGLRPGADSKAAMHSRARHCHALAHWN